jgi:hypothetical protein
VAAPRRRSQPAVAASSRSFGQDFGRGRRNPYTPGFDSLREPGNLSRPHAALRGFEISGRSARDASEGILTMTMHTEGSDLVWA